MFCIAKKNLSEHNNTEHVFTVPIFRQKIIKQLTECIRDCGMFAVLVTAQPTPAAAKGKSYIWKLVKTTDIAAHN